MTDALRAQLGVTVPDRQPSRRGHNVAVQFAQLRQQKVRIGTQDLRIAAIALANNATLLTRNTKDFAKVPCLLFEDWTVE